MNANEYCEMVEEKDLLLKQQVSAIRIIDDHSPLESLKDSGFHLVFEPSIIQDYRYLVRESILEKIERISKQLYRENKTLIIRSVWRSTTHQSLLWEARVDSLLQEYPELHRKEAQEMASYFIAPATQSMHSTGGAVDALIYDLRTDSVMDFGTNEGLKINLSRRCYLDHPDITPIARKSRRLLGGLFKQEGFVPDAKEYWHFDYGNAVWAVEKEKDHAIFGLVDA